MSFAGGWVARLVRGDGSSIGGAIGLSLLSRVVGVAREATALGFVGVSAVTDVYFVVLPVVLWVQNWAYGALSLVMVPRFVSVPVAERRRWVRRTAFKISAGAVGCSFLFVIFFEQIERRLADAQTNVLSTATIILLGASIPAGAVAGFLHGVRTAYDYGVRDAALILLAGNVFGVGVLLVGALLNWEAGVLLASSLFATQALTLALFGLVRRGEGDPAFASSGGKRTARDIAATTIENAGYNLNAVAHQAIAARLDTGAASLNAYTMRLLFVPLIGLTQPLQQRLLARLAVMPLQPAVQAVFRITGLAAAVGACGSFVALGVMTVVGHWFAHLFPAGAAPIPLLASMYVAHAVVVGMTQVCARLLFAQGAGPVYAAMALAAYFVGTLLKVLLLPEIGIYSLPAGGIAADSLLVGALLLAARSIAVEARAKRPVLQ